MHDFSRLMRDEIFLLQRGVRSSPISASVQGSEVHVIGDEVSFAEDQIIERDLPGGVSERFKIDRADYSSGMGRIPPNWTLHVCKVDASGLPLGRTPGDGRAGAGGVVITNSSNVQVGSGNKQVIGQGMEELLAAIDASDADASTKLDAKSRIAHLAEHPLVASILGGVAGGIVTAVTGGGA